jgi:hypothetical protein
MTRVWFERVRDCGLTLASFCTTDAWSRAWGTRRSLQASNPQRQLGQLADTAFRSLEEPN